MNTKDRLKLLADKVKPGSKGKHLDPAGPGKGWEAKDFHEEDLVDDVWLAENTKEVD